MKDDPGREAGGERSGSHQADLELTTVGIDIGSATSHLMFSRLRLQRLGRFLSSRYLVVQRETLYRSPILLTPFAQGDAIDAGKLEPFVAASFDAARLTPATIDSGAVILTGEAARRTNARTVADLFARHAGKFVCATAGHHLEARIAAHGSGAVHASRQAGQTILNVDVGGATSKLALVVKGEVQQTAAINVGARLVVTDEGGRIVRIESAAREVAQAHSISLALGRVLSPRDQRRLAGALADCLVGAIRGGTLPALARQLMLTPALPREQPIDRVMFSGGVSEYLYQREERDFGDLARPLAEALSTRISASALPAPLEPANEGIRATVIGASQFTVQVSGDTILISRPERLPLRNVPVLDLGLDHGQALRHGEVQAAIGAGFRRTDLREGDQPVALAIHWNGTPTHPALRGLADGIVAALPRTLKSSHPVILAFTSDLGSVVGEVLREELKVRNDVISIDGIEIRDLDYIDIGEMIFPARVVPVVVKSLLFGSS